MAPIKWAETTDDINDNNDNSSTHDGQSIGSLVSMLNEPKLITTVHLWQPECYRYQEELSVMVWI